MRDDVDLPDALPFAIRDRAIAFGGDAGVGAEQVDAAIALQRLVDQLLDVGLTGDIRLDVTAADFFGDFTGGFGVDVCNHDGLGALGCEPPAQRAPDPVRASGHHRDFVL